MASKIKIREWEKYFHDRGVNEVSTDIYLEYIESLHENQVPVIFEFEHLAKLLGIKLKVLADMVNAPESFYRSFQMPKKRGGYREIQAPYASMLEAQKWIYKNILLNLKVHKSVHGFVRNRSIFSNASLHVGKKTFLKIDISNFFPSIPKNWIIQLFNKLGYAPNVSFYLASLCCCNEFLAQGAATSPYLSNIVCLHLDNRLCLLARSFNVTYSRYADDIAFSGDYLPPNIVEIISNIINECGFEVNDDKTYLSTGRGKRILTGLSISGEKITIPRQYKRDLKLEVHYLIKYGYQSHIAKKKIRNPFYLESLLGKLLFWQQAEPDNVTVANYIIRLKDIRLSVAELG